MRVRLPLDDLLAWLTVEWRSRAAVQRRFQEEGTLRTAAGVPDGGALPASRSEAEVRAFVELASHVRLREACRRDGVPPESLPGLERAEAALRQRYGDAVVEEVLRRGAEIAAAAAPLDALSVPGPEDGDGDDDDRA